MCMYVHVTANDMTLLKRICAVMGVMLNIFANNKTSLRINWSITDTKF